MKIIIRNIFWSNRHHPKLLKWVLPLIKIYYGYHYGEREEQPNSGKLALDALLMHINCLTERIPWDHTVMRMDQDKSITAP